MDSIEEITDNILSEMDESEKYNLSLPFSFSCLNEYITYYWMGCGDQIVTWMCDGLPKGQFVSFKEMREYIDSGKCKIKK